MSPTSFDWPLNVHPCVKGASLRITVLTNLFYYLLIS
nr:MAG TPA: hypothetical protein [Caudoviricetes sp.]